MSEGKDQIEKTIVICKEIVERFGRLPEPVEDRIAEAKKRINDIVYVLEGIQNKIFFKTKASLSFTMPTLSSAERIQEALEDLSQSNGDFDSVLGEMDSLEGNVDILKVKVSSQDIIIT